eukprot:CAMPEP_0184309996 /NCGR_PEP_ID=MMETSP1049-20130417/21991_1 /TAXON_ID=77928 /ORGANISM="Proteomonas sulcata, Strain CCMP704" /LENGTH=65 /DNA_ID=CAMNT_0026623377 /DNA_START=36 /DNA_END=233 /DNA_ORIENTATION=+
MAQMVSVPSGQFLIGGTCNSLPGWSVDGVFNPTDYHADPDCRLNPMYGERGMGEGAAYGGGYGVP